MLKLNKGFLINGVVGLFFIICLSVRSGYSISPILLALVGLGYLIYDLIKKRKWQISPDEKWLIYSYGLYFSLFVLSLLIHQGRLKELDSPVKIVFLLTLLLLFSRFPIKFSTLIYAIPMGSMIAGITALIDRFYLHSQMAYAPRIMHIQGGDIAMSLGMFSLVCCIYFFIKQQKKWMLFCLLATLSGMLGSILSTARGGWIGVPFVLCFIFWAYRKYLSRTFFVSVISILVVAVGVAVYIPNTKIMKRINAAQHDITSYVDNKRGSDSTSVGARFEMWKSAFLMIKEKPVFGWGIEGVNQMRKEHQKQGIISKYASQFTHAHNQYLDDFSKRGVLGFIALLAVFLVPMRFFRKNLSDRLEVKVVAIFGMVHVISVMFYCFSQGFFSHNSGNIFYFFPVILFYAVILNLTAKKSAESTKS
ncbi:O-antigen ligase family protein [Basfia succiniciproducens]|uniref:O-antigen ligase n=1 Tax=Basfia succiniciproducens TaxID=653940 RepID=A0A1G5AYA4_9PAST|nr:O-antigen ligase [Basfia succiniciproducens]QIM69641.1 RfaL protein [Basfia succiniciproducens]SCX82846.1 O-antigen ligase [Basfia succiniciproducens]